MGEGDRERFVHLHVHSEYSLLDGYNRISRLVKGVKEKGMNAVALTDHGVMYGTIEFYKKAKELGVKPIVGCETYVAPRSRSDKSPGEHGASYHLVLLAKDNKGYTNLCKLVSAGFTEGFYYHPRIDKELLRNHKDGLIGLSGCLKGEVQYWLNKGDYDKAKELALEYQSIFDPGDFYIEIMDHCIADQKKIIPLQLQLAEETGIPLVATNDAHYFSREDSVAHDVLLCIQTGKTLDEPNRMKYATDEFYVKTPDEMIERFGMYPGAIQNSVEIAEKCNLELDLSHHILPDFPVPEGYTKETYIEKLCRDGIKWRYGESTPEIEERLKTELEVIVGKGLSAYFLIVADFIDYAKKHDIPVGPGRGSAAGSVIAYLMGITDLDPLKYDLIFERFLNPERDSLPDIDTDFCQTNREKVIKYVTQKYGSDRVSQIVTFGRMKARAAIRDVARVYGVSLQLADKLAKLVPMGATLEEALQTPELKEMYENNPDAKKVLDMAKQVEGMARNASIHAAGVVISQNPITDNAPLMKAKGDEVVAQYDMNYCADIGLIKMDFLGLRNLTILRDAVEMVKQNYGVELDLLNLPLKDPKTFELLQQGKTTGVFQLESPGMKRYLKQLKPERLEDIIAMVALYRPGPMQNIDSFIRRKHGVEKIQYALPELEPILKETYGVIVYQEQVMKIANEIGGYSLGAADILRRAMGKKKLELMAKHRAIFVAGAEKRGFDGQIASQIFDYMEAFAAYGFNKSHAACYALVTFQTAYMKAHYPQEYMAALLTSVMANTDEISKFIKECKVMGVEVLPPDINESEAVFSVKNGKIRFGLAAIKNVGMGPIESLLATRKKEGPFKDLSDFCCRVENCNRKVQESLIKCGAMDSLKETRATLLNNLDTCLEFGCSARSDKNSGQISLFEDVQDEAMSSPKLKKAPELDSTTLLGYEKELLGLYVSDHPLNRYKEVLEMLIPIEELAELESEQKVIIGGIINNIKKKLTKNNQLMAFIELEDPTGTVEVSVFPRTYEAGAQLITQDGIVMVVGKLELEQPFTPEEDDESAVELIPKILAEDIRVLSRPNIPRNFKKPKPAEKKQEKKYRGIHIKLENNGHNLFKLKDILSRYKGDEPVYFRVETDNKMTLLKADSSMFVQSLESIQPDVESLLGGNSIWIEV